MTTIALTGATGFIGRAVAAALAARGDVVRAIVRDDARASAILPASTQIVVADLEGEGVGAGALDGCDAVVHLAGEPISQRWSASWKRRIEESRIVGTRAVVRAIAAATSRPKVFLSGSAVGWYGDRGEAWVDESSAGGDGFLASVCRAWESEAEKAPSDVRTVRLRTGLVLDRSGGALPKMLLPFRMGIGGVLGSGRQWMPWISLEDEVGLILHALDDGKVSGPMNLVAPGPVTNEEFTRELAAALGRPAFLPAPAFGLRIVLGEMASLLLEGQRVRPSVATASGYVFRQPSLPPVLAAAVAPS